MVYTSIVAYIQHMVYTGTLLFLTLGLSYIFVRLIQILHFYILYCAYRWYLNCGTTFGILWYFMHTRASWPFKRFMTLGVGAGLKAEFHQKSVFSLLRCHICTFQGGGRSDLFLTGTLSPLPSDLAVARYVRSLAPSFLCCWTNWNAQHDSRLRSREPGVKLKGCTAGFPYRQWRRLHPTADLKMGCGADIVGTLDR